MYLCPRCGVQAYDRGRCASCGYADPRLESVRVISGQAVSPPTAPEPAAPPPLELDALLELTEDDGPMLEGFEPTALVDHRVAPSPKAEPAPPQDDVFTYTQCPRCQSPQPDPPETFCPHCSYRVRQRVRSAKAQEAGPGVDCRDCGTANPPGRTQCVHCGFPLRSGV